MKRFLTTLGGSRRKDSHIFLLAVTLTLALVAPSPAAQFTLGPHHFTLPDGFTIEIAAPPSLVPRPIEADFDEQGRLYVTDSSGTNDKPDRQLAEKPHRILRLEDSDGDGLFDKSVVFADKMMFPEGCLWHDGSLYVAAPPSIWKLTDTNNDGIADVRVEWFKGQTLTGCANDLHGPYLGPDGWIYWCKGAFARQTNVLGNGKTFISRASHIFRARPDGTGLEPIMTGGMDNPVGLAWTPEGELILSGTFFQNPGGGRRDGLIHVIYGGVYGKDHDVFEGHPRTGDLMPIMTHLGAAAPCGIARYESFVFGSEYRDNLFVCQFNMHKISRHILKPSGSTFATTDSDFLVSDNTDFHPTDVLEDADGSLLVVDTGGWYKLCCPTSQLHKPDVLGAIYRIRRNDAPKVNDSRGLKLAWGKMKPADLAKLIGDDRPAIRRSAIQHLSKLGVRAVAELRAVLKEPRFPEARRNAVWTLTRLDTARAREAVRAELIDRDGSVRQTAIHSASIWRDAGATPSLKALLTEQWPATRRAAAGALGRIRDQTAVPALLSVFANYGPQDRAHEHSLEFALIELADASAVRSYSQSDNLFVRCASFIALDQMNGGGLRPEEVIPLLASGSPEFKRAGLWIISHHPEWGGALAGFLKERITAPNLSDSERAELQQQLAQFARDAAVQNLLAETVRDGSDPARLTALRAMVQAGLKETPDSWTLALPALLDERTDPAVLRQAVAAARALPMRRAGPIGSPLLRLARDAGQPADLRLDAIVTVASGASIEPLLFDFVRSRLASSSTVAERGAAVTILTRAKLTPEQLSGVSDALKTAGPLELPKLLPAFAHSTNEALGLAVVDALKEARSFRSLRAEQVRPNITNFPATVRDKADELLATLNTDAAKQKARLDDLSLNLQSGDVRRGQALFNSQKAACSTCHSIGYLGGDLGPDLTKIGQIRTERDLLEAVVFPSASFVRSFEPMLVVTRSGDEQSGILRRDAPDEVVLATGPNTEARIPRADIAEMRPGTVSVMPQGLDEQLTRQELADLLAFLKATKW